MGCRRAEQTGSLRPPCRPLCRGSGTRHVLIISLPGPLSTAGLWLLLSPAPPRPPEGGAPRCAARCLLPAPGRVEMPPLWGRPVLGEESEGPPEVRLPSGGRQLPGLPELRPGGLGCRPPREGLQSACSVHSLCAHRGGGRTKAGDPGFGCLELWGEQPCPVPPLLSYPPQTAGAPPHGALGSSPRRPLPIRPRFRVCREQ